MTNGSFSIFPRSLRVGHSSDSQPTFAGLTRYSVDSDRPPTTSSIDEAATQRGIKRKQIIDELVSTEESYIADLKALAYLYSTLLVSASTVPNFARNTIQRNVAGLLHLHESLLEKLHQASFRSAARRWADTTSPTRLGPSHHTRWHSAEQNLYNLNLSRQRRLRSSIGSPPIKGAYMTLGIADPTDVLDVALIFQQSLTFFFTYEEYCANRELIAHELHRSMPGLWSPFEAGMESLGKTLVALDERMHQDRKGLTVNDLLIKPIQRICKYPLLFEDLLRQCPVADDPVVHSMVASLLCRLRDIVQAVNEAADDFHTRVHVQRRWLLQDRLNLERAELTSDRFRALGRIQLCGVLFVTYQTTVLIDGNYAMCALFEKHLIIAIPSTSAGKFEPIALILLADMKLESVGDGKGLQCQSGMYTWKVSFVVQHNLYEMLFSACSQLEEDQWLRGLHGGFKLTRQQYPSGRCIPSQIFLHLRSMGNIFHPDVPLSRQSSMQRAATVGNRPSICHIILRNTYNTSDLLDFRNSSQHTVSRSQSHATTNKVVVLAPKRSERTRMEATLNDVWTKERLPFPGMIASKGGQIIRASAGSLVRKLSLASIHGPFSKRSASMSLSSKKSYDTLRSHRREPPPFQVRRGSFEDFKPASRSRCKDVPEVDSMDKVIGRMIGGSPRSKRLSLSTSDQAQRGRSNVPRTIPSTDQPVGPEDPADSFYYASDQMAVPDNRKPSTRVVGDSLAGAGKRKRWSNPIARLKGFGGESLRHLLHSTR